MRQDGQTTAVELLVIAYQALAPGEQDEALKRMRDLALKRGADMRSETERILASLQRVAGLAGKEPEDLTSDDYRAAIKREIEEGGAAEPNEPQGLVGKGLGGIAPLSQVMKQFGTWRLAKEALCLSADSTALKIEARFACRRLGRVWRYSDEVLRETLRRCARELGYPPQVGEYRAWRRRELELAHAQGNRDFHLPSMNAYRYRNSYWKDTLRIFLGDGEESESAEKEGEK